MSEEKEGRERFSDIIASAEEYVKAELASQDGSHDFFHIDRVRKLALALAAKEKISKCRLDIIELAALLHDIKDYKYSGSETAGAEAVAAFLRKLGYPEERLQAVVGIVEGVGFKTELGGKVEVSPELAVVQDADRLDAIGAVGIARTFTYGGSRNRPMFDPARKPAGIIEVSKEEYAAQKSAPTINHFYEKLLKLKDMMKTRAGREIAQERHAFMLQFLDRFFEEAEGRA